MSADMKELHERLLGDEKACARLLELRGWTRTAIEQLGLGYDGDRVIFPVFDARRDLTGVLRYQPNPDRRGDRPKQIASPGTRRELFPPPELLPGTGTIWLVEGEPDSVAVTSAGLIGCGIPGVSSWRSEWAERFAGRDVVVCCDCDQPGRGLAARAAQDLAEKATTVKIVDLFAARDDGYDVSDIVKETDGEPLQAGVLLQRMADNAAIYLPESKRPPRPSLTVADWRRSLTDYFDNTGDGLPTWPIPFASLMDATDGGIRAGELWILAGYTSHAKSVYGDMMLDIISAAGARCHLYMTEMTIVQRGLRRIARQVGDQVPMKAMRKRDLTPAQRRLVDDEIARLKYPASIVTDWSPEHVAADIQASGVQFAVVDLLHGFHYRDERELSRFVEVFAAASMSDASGLKAGAAIVLVCHLNDQQMQGARSPVRPKPGLHSLKGATAIKQRADMILFSWLQDDEQGLPTSEGEVWIAKGRNNGMGRQLVWLDTSRIRLVEDTKEEREARAARAREAEMRAA